MFKPLKPSINFPKLEQEILDYWHVSGIVTKYLNKNRLSTRRFSFLDGPITANNPMGVHHGWGRTYKDLWQRFFNMRGYRQRFQNGFDCQGLWVEVEVERELGIKTKKDIENIVVGDKKASIAKFVDLCKRRVQKFANIQAEQSKRLGYFMDWENSYYTMSDENNYMIWFFIKTCHENGWIYKGTDVVPWCPRCETAISQHEILTEDYKEVTHTSIYLKLPRKDRKNEYLLIWTTTPWTIPANTAVAVDPDLEYSLVASDGEKYWVARKLAERIFGKGFKPLETVKGKELIGLRYKGPYDHLPYISKIAPADLKLFHTVVATDPLIMPISVEEGTGLVHTSTSTGEEDHRLGKKIGLPVIPAIDDRANYLEGFGELTGKNAKKNPDLILTYLENKKWIFKTEKYTHRYPVCWRCKEELVWRVTDEWYIAMDRPSHKAADGKLSKKTLRERMIEVAKKITWIPEFGLERELDWLNNMHDWLISKKNRYWGLAIPIWECKKCGYFEVIGAKEELKEKAVEGWKEFEGKSPHKPQIDEVKIKCPKCNAIISRIEPVGNPWLDAGIVSFSTFVDPETKKVSYTADKKYWKEWFPADFITESFPGQFKNWFYSLIAMSTVLENTNPFKTVLGFATLFGEDGKPMHKSLGNAIEFNEAADKIGVDVARWMYVTQNPSENLLFGYKKGDEVRRKFHLLLWNIYNFFVTYANVDKVQSFGKLDVKLALLDEWILSKLNGLIVYVTKNLENYDAQNASLAIQGFVDDLSTWYIRRSRERVGPAVAEGPDKSAFYAVLYKVLVTLSKLIAPFTPFIAEEIYRNLTGEESVHLVSWPNSAVESINKEIEETMEEVRKIAELGHAQRKLQNIKVRQPLSKFKVQNSKFKMTEDFIQLIKAELNVKKVKVNKGRGELSVELDFKLTPKLIAEGQAREWVRKIQLKRKEIGCGITDKVNVTLPDWSAEFTDYIKKETLAASITKSDDLSVTKV